MRSKLNGQQRESGLQEVFQSLLVECGLPAIILYVHIMVVCVLIMCPKQTLFKPGDRFTEAFLSHSAPNTFSVYMKQAGATVCHSSECLQGAKLHSTEMSTLDTVTPPKYPKRCDAIQYNSPARTSIFTKLIMVSFL